MTRLRIILYALASVVALAVPVLLFSAGAGVNPLLPASLIPALLAVTLLARTALKQLDAAHSLSAQLGEMIERRDIRHLFVPTPGTPEMNAVGHQLNVLIYTLAESAGEIHTTTSRQQITSARHTHRPDDRIDFKAAADAT